MKRIRINEEHCIGCRLCEVHCLVQHSRSKKIIKAFREERDLIEPRVRVEQMGYHSFALQCRHCSEPDCVAACISGALTKNPESGAVEHDSEKCVGCYSCVLTCPYGNIFIDHVHKKVIKCDLCAGLETMYCVSKCPNQALVYVED